MKKKQNIIPRNYLEKIPARADGIGWETGDDGMITLSIENTGWANRLAQMFFNRPKVSYVHLDRFGSFLWPLLDGEKNIIELGKLVEEQFGEEANPLYERLARYFQIVDSYHFIRWIGEEKKK